ncbi:unnamed protein product [Prorocentrum cordatum]|uniref:Uncharacterized protein n=1 Tax=Prorocentrum cordatum TaxID=2364126 RepID=A0ABN9QMV9_9DINO|nr:unnamed protein product [Polarella glacialis]
MFRMGLCEDAKEVAARICEWDDQLNARVSAPTGMPQNVERIISSKSSVLRSDDHAFMNHLTLQWLRAAARCWVDDVSYCWPLPTMSSLPRRISAPTRGGLQPRISRDPMERPAGDRPTGC